MPKQKKQTRSLQEQRALKAEKQLAAWIKRAGIAVNKVREYTKKVSYYRKVLTEQQIAAVRPITPGGRKFSVE